MTAAQLEEAARLLAKLPGVLNSSLKVRSVFNEVGTSLVFVEDEQGQVVRRIPEADLWSLLERPDKSTGQIFDKAM